MSIRIVNAETGLEDGNYHPAVADEMRQYFRHKYPALTWKTEEAIPEFIGNDRFHAEPDNRRRLIITNANLALEPNCPSHIIDKVIALLTEELDKEDLI